MAGNSLDVVLRELAVGEQHRRMQADHLLEQDGDLESLRWKLVSRPRENEIAPDHAGLAEYPRESVVNLGRIDQQSYSGSKRGSQMRASPATFGSFAFEKNFTFRPATKRPSRNFLAMYEFQFLFL